MDIGQGAGLASASGIRPFLPPLLAGALARADAGIDFDNSGWEFLESTGFLAAIVVIAIVVLVAERQGVNGETVRRGTFALSLVIGALLFGGSLAAGDHSAVIGLPLGVICAGLAALAVGGLLAGAAKRLDAGAAGLLTLYADGAALILAAIAIVLPPVSFLAVAAFGFLLIRTRGQDDQKYAGLRILR